MSAFDYTAQLHEMRRLGLFRRVTQTLLPVHAHAHLAAKWQAALDAARQELQMLRELNVELILSDAKRRAAYAVILVAALAVYAIDFVLLSAIAEYFARRVYSEPFMVGLARMVVPAAILVIEVMVASQRAFEREWAAEYGRARGSRVWTVFPVLLLLVLPSMLIATHLVTLPARTTRLWEAVTLFQLTGLLALAAVMHGVVLYSGQLAVEAKGYWYLRCRTWRLERRVRRLGDRQFKEASAATKAYILHERAVEEYRSLYPQAEVRPGPFDTITQQLLQTRLGHAFPSLPHAAEPQGREACEGRAPAT